MQVTCIRIGSWSDGESVDYVDDEHHYWAEAIEHNGRFYYRVDGITVEITAHEHRMVALNPRLYYFSTALKLHKHIEHARESNARRGA